MIITIQAAVPVPQITSARAITGVAGSPFSYQIASRTTPTKYYATGLPNGLSVVSATGEIRGVPSAAGTTEVLISAENAGGNGPAVTLSITIVDPRK
jgi:type VI secretion system secreted protein VgrG